MEIRKATIQDIDILCTLRKQQLQDEGITPNCNIDKELYRFFQESFQHDRIIEYLMIDNEDIIATAAICIYDYPPTYTNPNGRIAYVTNMYTHPHYRKQGIATKMLTLLKEEATNRDVHIMRLGASTLGHPVYQRFGFVDDDIWMHLDI